MCIHTHDRVIQLNGKHMNKMTAIRVVTVHYEWEGYHGCGSVVGIINYITNVMMTKLMIGSIINAVFCIVV